MRFLIASNRLPVTVVKRGKKWSMQPSAGGLATGVSAYLNSMEGEADYTWVGWPGRVIPNEKRDWLEASLKDQFHAHPVYLSQNEVEKVYLGFCNKTLWPLFHYFTTYASYDEESWSQYKRVNEKFRDAILEIARPDDWVWVHDYHLMLLPQLLREAMPALRIGFFLHIPFPSYEIFRLLPMRWRSEILEGLLGADLVGFHTHEYTQYFLRCVLRILGLTNTLGRITVGDRIVKAGTFPMGIPFQKFFDASQNREVQEERENLLEGFAGLKVILSMDRLDYSKGILSRLHGYERFLERNPQWHEKVVLSMVVVPSRSGVERYRRTKRQLDELVGRINGRFGSVSWTPIMYQYTFLPFPALAARYNVSDVALVTPLRDGMNLIAKEYVAARRDTGGVLILSETTGAALELGEAIIINPNDVEAIADALARALEMPLEEQKQRMSLMQERLRAHDVVRWAGDFVEEMLSLREEQEKFQARFIRAEEQERLAGAYQNAHRRVLFLDHDGTLVSFADDPRRAKPDDTLLELLRQLSTDPRNDLILISGRDRDTLAGWFGSLNNALAAEHGIWIREPDKDWRLLKPVAAEWKTQLRPLFERYVDRTPGSFLEEKEYSLAWHYRKAHPEVASLRAKELIDLLLQATTSLEVQVLQGNKVVEARSAGVTKGSAALHFLAQDKFDFILAMGDDQTDEDLFAALPEHAFSFRVGHGASRARFNLRGPAEARQLLALLAGQG